jgi:hypothetical protein
VDKNLNSKNNENGRSIFCLGDFRHNLNFKSEAETYQKGLSTQPKRLLAWDDGTIFNPKTKRDIFP